MRLLSVAALLAALVALPAAAAEGLPEGVEQLLTCGSVYSMRADEVAEAGDADSEAEFRNMGEALIWQAEATLAAAGFTAGEIEDAEMNSALLTGFNYGAGMGEELLADCLAAWDSP
jgi:hypothetical protein